MFGAKDWTGHYYFSTLGFTKIIFVLIIETGDEDILFSEVNLWIIHYLYDTSILDKMLVDPRKEFQKLSYNVLSRNRKSFFHTTL